MTMKFNAAVALMALACGSANAKEELLRRRDIAARNLAVAWRSESNADASDSFFIKPDWGEQRYNGGKSTKAPKGTKVPKSYTSKGPKSSKEPKSTKRPYPPNVPPYSPPYVPPAQPPYSPPYSAPTKCPDIKTGCSVDGPDTCDLHSSCHTACVPKFCKLPPDPHKVEGPSKQDMYVKLGQLCGYMKYVEGRPVTPRHDIETCCEVVQEVRFYVEEDFECVTCGDCKAPQLVNDACCKIALEPDDGDGRAGEYRPKCEYGCCKCGPGNGRLSYACLPSKDAVCREDLCDQETPIVPTSEGDTTSTSQGVGLPESSTMEATSQATTPSTTEAGPTATGIGTVPEATTTTRQNSGFRPLPTTPELTTTQATQGTTTEDGSTSTEIGTVPEVTTTTREGFLPPPQTTAEATTTQATQGTTTPPDTTQPPIPVTTTAEATTLAATTTTTEASTQATQGPQLPTTTGDGVQLGLQPSCNINDVNNYNFCIDLTSTLGRVEPWMQSVLDAASTWEQTITGDLPPVVLTGPVRLPPLTQDCTAYPAVIDDIYICAQDVVITSGAVAIAGPSISRQVPGPGGTQVNGFPIASRIGVSSTERNNAGLFRIMMHEIGHALGFPSVSDNLGFWTGDRYSSNSNAGAAWAALGCRGDIPMQPRPGGHWDETCLGEELMTPTRIVEPGPVPADGFAPLSSLTIGAMEDMGYQVSYANAEPFDPSDLGSCPPGTCDEVASVAAGATIGVDDGLPVLAESEKIACMNDFKDDLIFFHEQLEKFEYTNGEGVERIDALIAGQDGHLHSFSFTYEDVMNM